MELEKLLEKVEKIQEGNTPEETAKELEQQSKEQQQNDGLETNNSNQGDGDKSQNQNSEENKEQPADNGNGQPEFFKDFEGKAQVSPDDIKTILSDPTKGQQLIDWAKTQNAIVKEVPGLQNTMKTAQANGNNQNGGDQAANGNNQNDGNQADDNTAQNGGNQAAPQRPFTDYLEPLGKIMKTQADCDKAIEFFTNLKNTKPAAAEGGNEAPQTNPAN